jgi:hypothetical protein
MSEATSNVEFAQRIHEHGEHHPPPTDRHSQWIEIMEALVPAIVAVATAWSGYEAAKWDALSAQEYNLASRTAVVSQEKVTLAGQDRLYDITTFDAWVAAKVAAKTRWPHSTSADSGQNMPLHLRLGGSSTQSTNPSAPPGPIFMAEYTDANGQESARLAKEAKGHYEDGVSTRDLGDKYVKVTVLLATVLLLTALSQGFEIRGPRVAVVAVAFVLLVVSAYWILTFPRA